jgi:hypothetical protein
MLRLFRSLNQEQQRTVAAFAAFLAGNMAPSPEAEPEQPLDVPRPDQESVVKAIKRLRATYPMLDQNKLFHETSQHMTEHLMHGKSAVEVINELEAMFSRQYQRYIEDTKGSAR